MLIHRADLNKTIAIDYRESAPALTTKDVFLDANGEADPFKSRFSGLAIGVPGTVAGLELAWRQYGSGRFSLADLVAPAARLAHQGLTVDDDLAEFAARRRAAARPASFVGAHLSRAGRERARRRRSYRARRSRGDARRDRRRGRERLLPRPDRAKNRRRRAAGRRADDARRSRQLSRRRARAGSRNLSRPRNRLDAAAVLRRRAYRGNPQHPRRLSARRAGAQFGRDDSRDGGGGKARLRRPRGLSRRSRFRPHSAARADLESLRRPFAREHRARPRASGERDRPRRAAALRERPDDAFFDRRRRRRRGLQHLHAEFLLRQRARRGRDRKCCSTTNSTISRPSAAPPTPMACSAATPTRRARTSGRYPR